MEGTFVVFAEEGVADWWTWRERVTFFVVEFFTEEEGKDEVECRCA